MAKVSLNQALLIYVGCYTEGDGGRGSGISVARRDAGTGALTPIGTAATTPAPSYLSGHPDLPVLYSVHERAEGSVSAWGIGSGGALAKLSGTGTGGEYPCHAAVIEGHLAVANYGSGSVSLHPLGEDGSVLPQSDLAVHSGQGPHADRQEGPHAHQVSPDGAGGLRAIDLGIDTIFGYPVEKGLFGAPTLTHARPGTGPRHLAHDGQGFVYVAGELDVTVTAYATDPETGELREHARVPAGTKGGFPSEIAVSGDGRFLYVASRGPDTIAAFALSGGIPELVGEVSTGGEWPRHFALIGEHLYVANERSDSIVTFRLDGSSGLPEPTGEVWDLPSPTCVLAMPTP